MPDLPPIERGAYLVAYLFEAGPMLVCGMGASPLTFSEIEAWCGRVGIELRPWESRYMRRLSREYLNESQRAEKRDCQAPWRAPDAKPEVSDTQAAIRALANL